jgi:hypothetical protein
LKKIIVEQKKEQETKNVITIKEVNELVQKAKISEAGKTDLRKIILENLDSFSTGSTDVGKFKGSSPVKLELKDPLAEPVWVRPRRIAVAHQPWLREELEKMTKAGIIREVHVGSPYNAPMSVIPKRSGGLRIVVDLRGLNNIIKSQKWPLPNLTELLEGFKDANLFTSYDFTSAFFHIAIDDKSQPLTAFSAMNRQYMYQRLPMGCKVSPHIFAHAIAKTIPEEMQGRVVSYLDDLVSFDTNEKAHLQNIERMFKAFREYGWKLKLAKCGFCMRETEFVGHEISADGYRPKRDNVDRIDRLPTPTSKKEVRGFTGACAFYSNAIPALQLILSPLHDLTAKNKKFEWGPDCEAAFNGAKTAISKRNRLAFLSEDKRTEIICTTDASDVGFGCMISQRIPTGIEQPIKFMSGKFKGASQRWPIFEKELAAFIRALETFRPILLGRPFLWRTDNKALSTLLVQASTKSAKEPSPKLLRWIEKISEFDFTVQHHAGDTTVMAIPDLLSRYPSETTPMICYMNKIQQKYKSIGKDIPIWIRTKGTTFSEVANHQQEDENLMKRQGEYASIKGRFKLEQNENGLIYWSDKAFPENKLLVIPETLAEECIKAHHFPLHLRFRRLKAELRESGLYIPKLKQKLDKFIRNCEGCLVGEEIDKLNFEKIEQTRSQHPYTAGVVDLMGPLPRTPRNKSYILVFIDEFSHWVELRALKDKHTINVCKALTDIFFIRGPPLVLKSDNGSEFKSGSLKELLKSFGVVQKFGCPYRPQSQSLAERTNKELKKHLKTYTNGDNNWDLCLPPLQLSLNLTYKESLKTSPFKALHNWLLCKPAYAEDPIKNLDKIPYENSHFIAKAGRAMVRALSLQTAQQAEETRDFLPEDRTALESGVTVLMKRNRAPGESKLFQNWKGQLKVVKRLDVYTYLLESNLYPRRQFIVHRSRIRPIANPQTVRENDPCAWKVRRQQKRFVMLN